MHPIAKALRERGWTQQQLVDAVNKLKPRRPNGDRIHLTQSHLSDVISEKSEKRKHLSVPMAKAVASALGLDAAEILLYEPPAKPRRSKSAA